MMVIIMKEPIDSELLIDAICGKRFTMKQMCEFEKMGLARFSGNQHNPDWKIIRSKVQSLSESGLRTMYFDGETYDD